MGSKKQLAIFLSKLKTFENPKLKLEQYSTDSNIAADLLWEAYLRGDIQDKIIADFGAGTGILGIGALLLGAKKVYFIEKDNINLLKENLKEIEHKNYEIINKPIEDFNKKVNTIIQNPPFGTKTKHADKVFLEKAFTTSNKIYSLHKTSTETFINSISKDYNFKIILKKDYKYPLKKQFKFQKKKIEYINVSLWVFEKNDN